MNIFFINGFLNLLSEFLNDLKILLPIHDDILATQKTIELAEWSNSAKIAIVDGFMYYIAPFYKKIYMREESFFLNTKNIENNQRFQEVDQQTQSENYTKMFQLKGVWEQFTPHNKLTIWDYFNALITNGAKASSNPQYQEILVWAEEHKSEIEKRRQEQMALCQ